MGEYASVKIKKLLKVLKKLSNKRGDLEIKKGGRHTYSIKHPFGERPFPLPVKHNEVNKYIVKDLMELLVKSKMCTKEEFDQWL